jgi:sarcosine oxidase subunit gamma
MSELAAAPAFRGMAGIGDGAGVHARLWPPTPIISVLARKGRYLAQDLGISDGPRQSRHEEATVLGIGPGRWLFLGREIDQLSQLVGRASLADHSDGYAVFEIWGPDVRSALAKGVPLDLHPGVFTDDVAVTVIAHIGAIIWQCAPDRFAIAVFRSYAGSFWHWLAASAAEFGLVAEDA